MAGVRMVRVTQVLDTDDIFTRVGDITDLKRQSYEGSNGRGYARLRASKIAYRKLKAVLWGACLPIQVITPLEEEKSER